MAVYYQFDGKDVGYVQYSKFDGSEFIIEHVTQTHARCAIVGIESSDWISAEMN